MRIDKFIIFSAGGEARVVARMPALRLDEFAYRLVLEVPDAWGHILGQINVTLPEPNPTVDLDQVEPEEEVEE